MSSHSTQEASILALLSLHGFSRHGRGTYGRKVGMSVGIRSTPKVVFVGSLSWNSLTFNASPTQSDKSFPFYAEFAELGEKLSWMKTINNSKFTDSLAATLEMQIQGLDNYASALSAPNWLNRYKTLGRNKILTPYYLMGVPPDVTNLMLENDLPAYSPILFALMNKKISFEEVDEYLLLPMGLQSSLLSES